MTTPDPGRSGAGPARFALGVGLTNACNLRCAYCRCPDVKIEMMTTAQWVETIDGLGSHGTMRIKYQGGEPTLRTDFRTICAASQAAGIITAVVTNGLQFAAKPELFDHLDEIVFSLDSATPEHTDKMRGAGVHALRRWYVHIERRSHRLRTVRQRHQQ